MERPLVMSKSDGEMGAHAAIPTYLVSRDHLVVYRNDGRRCRKLEVDHTDESIMGDQGEVGSSSGWVDRTDG